MSQLTTRDEVEDLCEQELQSKFHALMQDLIWSQNVLNERAKALTSVETVEARTEPQACLRAAVHCAEMRVLRRQGPPFEAAPAYSVAG